MRSRDVLVSLALTTGCYTGVEHDLGAAHSDDSMSPGGADADSGGDDAPPSEPPGGESECEGEAALEAPARRLTRVEYNNAIRDLLGDDSAPADAFVSDEQVGHFHTNSHAPVATLTVEQYLHAAEEVAARAVADVDALTGCVAGDVGEDACAEAFVTTFGRRVFRRPLDEREHDALLAVYHDADEPYAARIELVLQAMLQAPQFLYRVELGAAHAEPGDVVELDDYELASRLSFFLWASTPDDALLDAAARGELATPSGLASAAQRMIDDPRFEYAVTSFVAQWLSLGDLDEATKDEQLFPEFEGLRAAFSAETEDFAREVLRGEHPTLGELLTASYSYLTPELAAFYGENHGGAAGEVLRVDLDPSRRAGLLTQASVLAANALENRTSIVLRGQLVRERLLCQSMPPPPDDIDPSGDRTTNPQCAACHALMDPIGAGFESYDAIGAFRTVDDDGKPIDDRGRVVNVEDIDAEFDGAVELAGALASSSTVSRCFASLWLEFGVGHEAGADSCALDDMHRRFVDRQLDVPTLLMSVVSSDQFRTIQARE